METTSTTTATSRIGWEEALEAVEAQLGAGLCRAEAERMLEHAACMTGRRLHGPEGVAPEGLVILSLEMFHSAFFHACSRGDPGSTSRPD